MCQNGQSSNLRDINIRQLFISDLQKVAALQDLVVKELDEASSFYPLSEAETANLLGEQGISLGAFNQDNEIIGYAAAYFPGHNDDNLGRDMGLSENELEKVAHLEVGLVHPVYRGRSLQFRLYQQLIDTIIKQGNCRYILSTVAPGNYAALSNSLRLMLYIIDIRFKYGSLIRYLLMRDLQEPITIDLETVIKCSPADIELQQCLLKQGFCGYAIDKSDMLFLCYGLNDLS